MFLAQEQATGTLHKVCHFQQTKLHTLHNKPNFTQLPHVYQIVSTQTKHTGPLPLPLNIMTGPLHL